MGPKKEEAEGKPQVFIKTKKGKNLLSRQRPVPLPVTVLITVTDGEKDKIMVEGKTLQMGRITVFASGPRTTEPAHAINQPC